jgi:hypothetical protein
MPGLTPGQADESRMRLKLYEQKKPHRIRPGEQRRIRAT